MRFQIVSHAGLMVEKDGVQLLNDPWVKGSVFWRSWWNYPPVSNIASRRTTFQVWHVVEGFAIG